MENRIIKDMEACERPRERLLAHGASGLSNAELLAILIGTGSVDENAVDLMRRILNDCGGSLKQLERLDVADFCRYKGIGEAKALTLIAACELGKRRLAEGGIERPRIQNSEDIFRYFHDKLETLDHEEFHVLLLNNRLTIIGEQCISQGGLTSTAVDIRLLMRAAIVGKATAIALCHNHPSGNPRPSGEDDRLTQKLKAAAATMDLRLIDHIILTDEAYFSYQDEGRL